MVNPINIVTMVHVGASPAVGYAVEQKSRQERENISAKVSYDLEDFMRATNTGSPDVVKLCTTVASHFGENVVASHFLNHHGALLLYLDLVDNEVRSKFQYIQHSDWAH